MARSARIYAFVGLKFPRRRGRSTRRRWPSGIVSAVCGETPAITKIYLDTLVVSLTNEGMFNGTLLCDTRDEVEGTMDFSVGKW